MVEFSMRIGIVVLSLAMSAGVGYLVLAAVMKHIGSATTEGADGRKNASTLRGGTWIGILERIGTTVAILSSQFALIAVIVAIKGFGRFDALKDNPEASEKFVIGTLLSLLCAGASGALGLYLLGLLH